MSNVDRARLSLHAGTLRPVSSFEQKAELAARAGLGAWALRAVRGGSTLEMLDAIPGDRLYLVHLADVPPGPRQEAQDDGRLSPGEGAGPLRDIVKRVRDKGYAGFFVVEILSQALWREDPLTVGRRCHAGAVTLLESV